LMPQFFGTLRVIGMEYKQLYVKAFEREPGKWRADIRRADGNPFEGHRPQETQKYCNEAGCHHGGCRHGDAMALIDAESFARDRAATEKFWRRGQSSYARTGRRKDKNARYSRLVRWCHSDGRRVAARDTFQASLDRAQRRIRRSSSAAGLFGHARLDFRLCTLPDVRQAQADMRTPSSIVPRRTSLHHAAELKGSPVRLETAQL
jgi:hypothetical protein